MASFGPPTGEDKFWQLDGNASIRMLLGCIAQGYTLFRLKREKVPKTLLVRTVKGADILLLLCEAGEGRYFGEVQISSLEDNLNNRAMEFLIRHLKAMYETHTAVVLGKEEAFGPRALYWNGQDPKNT